MDERTLKRLLIIVGISIIAIFIFKTMLSRTIVNLNKVAIEKKQAAATPPTQQQSIPPASDNAIINETLAASAVDEVTTMELPAASGVSDGR